MAAAMTSLGKSEMPALLQEIPDPPALLYLRGALPSPDIPVVAVVGTRRPSRYGVAACRSLIEGLAGYPLAVVSGLALGIDAVAHQAALASGITTIAVPGSGLNDSAIYPRSHLPLARKIIENGGALLSEYDPPFVATPWSFPKRNRIMAGLSKAVLIVEATMRSGTLITARLATEYNREVLCVPGPIDSPQSEGPNRLIQDGAAPVLGPGDILAALGIPVQERAAPELTGEEAIVIEYLASPMPKDKLLRALPFAPGVSLGIVMALELRGIIAEEGGVVRRAI